VKHTAILFAALLGAGIISGPATAQSPQDEAQAIAAAQPAIDALLKSLPKDSSLAPRRVFVDSLGQAHVRLAQSYRGIPVFEGEAVVHVDTASGRVTGITNATLPFAAIATTPGVSEQHAADVARGHFRHPLGLASKRQLAIIVQNGAAQLAWKVHDEGHVPEGRLDTVAYVGAKDGKVLRAWNNLHTGDAAGTAAGMYMKAGGQPIRVDLTGSTYTLRHVGPPLYATCNMNGGRSTCAAVTNSIGTFGNGAISTSGPTAAADAQFGAEMTHSYYAARFGRNGIDDAGMTTSSRVHYSKGYENAFWSDSCSCMTYGDGKTTFYPLVSLDVAGHEMSHGVTSREANLTYSGESGGLNEATSDIFGTMVEYYAAGSFDVPDYKIGEMIMRSNWANTTNRAAFSPAKALRYMYKPSTDGASKDCWYSGIGSIDVHYSSGVANHFFYLLAEGSAPAAPLVASPTCNGATLAGIGRAKAEQIWYRALTVYMVPSTNYAGARAATISAAKDLYGAASAEAGAVAAAWSAVSVN